MELTWHKFAESGTTKRGDGHAVVIFPGLGANGGSVATLREHCRSLGYDAFDWGRGFNTGPEGDLDAWLHTLKSQVVDLLAGHTRTGYSHRLEPGRALRTRNRQADGTAHPTGDHDRSAFQRGGRPHQPGLALPLAEWQFVGNRSGAKPAPAHTSTLRTTSIYSRSDGVVAWQMCRHDKRSSLVHDIEVDGSHMGMGWNRDVLAAISDRLGQPPGPWRRYVRAP